MTTTIRTHNLGYPRIGEKRELKKATEAYWKGLLSLEELQQVGRELRKAHWLAQKEAGIDLIPSNDFSFYDQTLDMSCLLGNIPPRFHWDGKESGADLVFRLARGTDATPHEGCVCSHSPAFACEMTKWFDTNYHYIVPEFHHGTVFKLSSTKPFDEFNEALALGLRTKPVLIGPVTYLTLGKVQDPQQPDFDRFSLMEKVLPVYVETLRKLQALGAEWVQIDEPVLSLDLTQRQKDLLIQSITCLRLSVPGLKILLATYFGPVASNLDLIKDLNVHALHVDSVRAPEEIETVARNIGPGCILSLGIINGRNIWKNDFEQSLTLIEKVKTITGTDRLWLAPSCSLLHTPVSLRHENALDSEIKNWLAFSEEKLREISTLAFHASGHYQPFALKENQEAHLSRRASKRIHRTAVKARAAAVKPEDGKRHSAFPLRQKKQQDSLHLPLFPTTTIGSFPQTAEVRKARARFKRGELSTSDYEIFLQRETERCIRIQEDIGLDVLVHGEFERNDMVEYFGEQLDGFAFTANGWVQSYGSRCVKPPVIFGDVSRLQPMTVGWSAYAQSLTNRPMKGMLTGPITILQWSFVRDDQPRSETARQIALAIRDEVLDLEKAGLKIIQIDEPALREGLPLRRKQWKSYLDWSTEAFRLSAAGVRDETQIHTHMCYCEFNDIIDSIASLDADVISIETSRSNMELLEAFVSFQYPNEVGPGVWDIHSPRVPETAEMTGLLRKAAKVLPLENLWINPDCGLKTRGWEETTSALENMVAAAVILRKEQAPLSPAPRMNQAALV